MAKWMHPATREWMQPVTRHVRTGAHVALTASAALLVSGGLLTVTTVNATANATTPTCTPATPCINTVAGNNKAGYSGDHGPAWQAMLNNPTGVAEVVAGGPLVLADTVNQIVREVVNPSSPTADTITTIAGTPQKAGFSGDGGAATSAKLSFPTGVAVDSKGDEFIADTGNNRIREVNTNGVITTIGGSGSCVKNMNNNQLADPVAATSANVCMSSSLSAPTGIAVDSHGDVFFSDTGHNVVRELIPSAKGTWMMVLVAGKGSPGYSGDGGKATSALLNAPTGVVVDALGDVYISDTGNCRVREVNTGGIINTVAGNGKCGYSTGGGVATSAELKAPTGLGFNSGANLYIADTGNQVIRQVNGGTISTYAGTPGVAKCCSIGDKGPATAAILDNPTGVVADPQTVYFADTSSQAIRGIFGAPPPVLPQSGMAILLPITGGLVVVLGGSAVWVLRRRRHSAAAAVAS
jgi:hypothetical protein